MGMEMGMGGSGGGWGFGGGGDVGWWSMGGWGWRPLEGGGVWIGVYRGRSVGLGRLLDYG